MPIFLAEIQCDYTFQTLFTIKCKESYIYHKIQGMLALIVFLFTCRLLLSRLFEVKKILSPFPGFIHPYFNFGHFLKFFLKGELQEFKCEDVDSEPGSNYYWSIGNRWSLLIGPFNMLIYYNWSLGNRKSLLICPLNKCWSITIGLMETVKAFWLVHSIYVDPLLLVNWKQVKPSDWLIQ